jgi:hypothetical protein
VKEIKEEVMCKVKIWIAILTIVVGLGGIVPRGMAQDQGHDSQEKSAEKPAAPKSLNAYRMDFLLTELEDGKKNNSRSYSLLAREGILNKLRAGVRVPIATKMGSLPQFQYLDVGMNIDCRVEEREGSLVLNAIADSSSFSLPGEPKAPGSVADQPVIRQMRSEINTVINLGKMTVISSMDDPSSKRRFQLEVTATKVK